MLGTKELVICKLYGPNSSFWLNYSTTANEFINPQSIKLPAYTASKCTLQIFCITERILHFTALFIDIFFAHIAVTKILLLMPFI